MKNSSNTLGSLNGSVVLITGALTGIGRATAFAFANEGAKLVVSGRKAEEGEQLARELENLGIEAVFIKADVRFEQDVKSLVDSTIARFGRLDIAVNNAGTEGQPGFIVDQTEETYKATFDTNVFGTLISMKHELRVMLAQKSGSIVNISSTFGTRAGAGASVYVGSKHAIEGITKTAALEGAAFGVRVNAVAPGPIETGMLHRFTGTEEAFLSMSKGVPMKRIGQPEEVAQAIVFLGSDKSPFLSGQILAVDGAKLAVDSGSLN
ncbi:short chain dehydrogenase [Dyadobacter frigoris]|uniref:SDR family NAD(P)-dependent oxidoreductase n=1 Tax=Dyadobacter frigoris TaxID=2576211 RepID=UPI0024A089DF|nr:glucose 1-dehydrogenase [Dyadobacter frigoris]GLU55222.1 short chain dehydrogenase [Dyadobacter frigoris]